MGSLVRSSSGSAGSRRATSATWRWLTPAERRASRSSRRQAWSQSCGSVPLPLGPGAVRSRDMRTASERTLHSHLCCLSHIITGGSGWSCRARSPSSPGLPAGWGGPSANWLAQRGARVALVARTQADLERTEAHIRTGAGGEAASSSPISPSAVRSRPWSRLSLPSSAPSTSWSTDAFWGPPGSLEQTDEAFWDRTLDTCFEGALPVHTRRAPDDAAHTAAGPSAQHRLHGRQGGRGQPDAYCAAKWGLEGLTAALRIELGKDDIRVHLLSPGATDTSFWEPSAPEPDAADQVAALHPGADDRRMRWSGC